MSFEGELSKGNEYQSYHHFIAVVLSSIRYKIPNRTFFNIFVQQYTFNTLKVECMNDWKNFRVTEHRKSYQEKIRRKRMKGRSKRRIGCDKIN